MSLVLSAGFEDDLLIEPSRSVLDEGRRLEHHAKAKKMAYIIII